MICLLPVRLPPSCPRYWESVRSLPVCRLRARGCVSTATQLCPMANSPKQNPCSQRIACSSCPNAATRAPTRSTTASSGVRGGRGTSAPHGGYRHRLCRRQPKELPRGCGGCLGSLVAVQPTRSPRRRCPRRRLRRCRRTRPLPRRPPPLLRLHLRLCLLLHPLPHPHYWSHPRRHHHCRGHLLLCCGASAHVTRAIAVWKKRR